MTAATMKAGTSPGQIAAKMSKTGIIGYIVPFRFPR